MKVELKVAAKRCAVAAIIAIMSAAMLSGCAVAMLRGAAGSSGGSGGGTATPASQPASPAATDGSLSTAVRSRFGADPALKALKIVVDTHDGIVTLRGQVNTVEQRNAAQAQARAVSGVKGVNNQLAVR